jgi:hypothetical protein
MRSTAISFFYSIDIALRYVSIGAGSKNWRHKVTNKIGMTNSICMASFMLCIEFPRAFVDTLMSFTMQNETNAFYDAEMISQLINTMLRHSRNPTLDRTTADEVKYVMNQLKAVGVSIP